MRFLGAGVPLALAFAAAASLAAQQPTVTIDGDDITLRGCIRQVDISAGAAPSTLIWSRSDIMLAGVTALDEDADDPVGTSGIAGRVFYWLDDDDLSKHVGQQVEITGELGDFEKGEIEIKRDGKFTEIELELDGEEEQARVPTAWLAGTNADKDQEFDIVARRIDVQDVRVLGACTMP